MSTPLTPTELAKAAAISVPFASQILGGTRNPSPVVALRAYRALGVKLGPLVGLEPSEIELLAKMSDRAAEGQAVA